MYKNLTSRGEIIIPIKTIRINIKVKSVKIALKNFFDSSIPFSFSSSVNTGIKLATIFPSANNLLNKLGRIKPIAKASAIKVVPSKAACIWSLTSPNILLIAVTIDIFKDDFVIFSLIFVLFEFSNIRISKIIYDIIYKK